jgi:hypothetical protein
MEYLSHPHVENGGEYVKMQVVVIPVVAAGECHTVKQLLKFSVLIMALFPMSCGGTKGEYSIAKIDAGQDAR